jgi:hypothetical protein
MEMTLKQLLDQLDDLYKKTTPGVWQQGSFRDCVFSVKDEIWKDICRVKRNSEELNETNPDLHDATFIAEIHRAWPLVSEYIKCLMANPTDLGYINSSHLDLFLRYYYPKIEK